MRTHKTPASVLLSTFVTQKRRACLNEHVSYWESTCSRTVNSQATVQVCVETNSYGSCVRTSSQTVNIQTSEPYACSGETRKCVEWGQENYPKEVEFDIKFVDMPALSEGEKELFHFKVHKPKPEEDKYELTLENGEAGQDYKIKRKGVFLSSKKVFTVKSR